MKCRQPRDSFSILPNHGSQWRRGKGDDGIGPSHAKAGQESSREEGPVGQDSPGGIPGKNGWRMAGVCAPGGTV